MSAAATNERPADADRTCGHGKIESLSAGIQTILILILILLLTSSSLPAQTTLWSQVSTTYNAPKTLRVNLTRNETQSIRTLLRSPAQRDIWACGDDPDQDPDWVNDVFFSTISLARGHKTLLVEAGPGCGRGGQGANGAMWIVEFHGSKPTLLATPAQNFNGWLYSIQHTSHSDYDDIVLGWHMSAFETGLSYFRFNGRSYRAIASATLKIDDDGKGTIIPGPAALSH
jgi:hypothetical protein